jgi:hypothetical protein
MSVWRRDALKGLPELRAAIEQSWSPMSMWIEIHLAFEDAYRASPRADDLIKRIYALATAQARSRNSDTQTAVACAFFEHLPLNRKVWRDLHNHMPLEVFENLEPALKYHVPEAEFADLKREYVEQFKETRGAGRRPKQRAG